MEKVCGDEQRGAVVPQQRKLMKRYNLNINTLPTLWVYKKKIINIKVYLYFIIIPKTRLSVNAICIDIIIYITNINGVIVEGFEQRYLDLRGHTYMVSFMSSDKTN